MINLILSLILFSEIIYYSILSIKVKSAKVYAITRGQVCYKCGDVDPIEGYDFPFKKRVFCCISCDRDSSLEILRRPYLKWKFKFDKFLLSERFEKMQKTYLILIVISLVLFLSIFFIFGFNLSPLMNLMNVGYWSLNILRLRLIKKPL